MNHKPVLRIRVKGIGKILKENIFRRQRALIRRLKNSEGMGDNFPLSTLHTALVRLNP